MGRQPRDSAGRKGGVVSKRETWRDFMPEGAPEPALYTRAEIAESASYIDLVAPHDIRYIDLVTPDDIRYWEYQGVLPRSIRRRYAGATRAVYPEWYAGLAREVRALQRQGRTLDEIKPKIRKLAVSIAIRPASTLQARQP